MFEKKIFCRSLAIFQIVILLTIFSPHSFAQKKGRIRTLVPETVFSNPAGITISTASTATFPRPAQTYPSQITVSGMAGNTTRVAVTLTGLTNLRLSDLDLLLVSPTGAKYIFASDLVGSTPVEDRVYTFADDAAATMTFNNYLQDASFKPTSGDVFSDTFPVPAPAGPYLNPTSTTFATAFNGVSPNGAWSLYVVDDTAVQASSLNDGWSLNITTDSTAATDFTNASLISVNNFITPATPYSSAINVSGMTGKISNLKVTLTGLTHTAVFDVDILLVSPDGRGLVLLSDAGTGGASGVNLTFDDTAAAGQVPNSVVSGTYRPTDNSVPDSFPAPAPYRPWHVQTGSNQLSNFNGYNPNGTWQLFIVDDAITNSGSISGGWSLDITTTPVTPPPTTACSSPSFTRNDISVGAGPTNVAVADFNNDTEDDFAVTNQISNDVSILLGDGSGGFAPQPPLTPGSGPYTVAAGKFNGDSNFDLAVVNSSSNNVSIFLGNGNGTFSGPANFFVGVNPISISVGDFNSDTKQDLAVANFGGFFTGSVSLLLGNGSGGFTAGNNVSTGAQPAFVATADLNGDTKLDMVVANYGLSSISTFFGDGAGGFVLSQNITTGGSSGPVAIEIADLFGSDGIKDLAVADFQGIVQTYVGAANGTFLFGGSAMTGVPGAIAVTSGDFGLSGTNMLAAAASSSNFVRVGPNSVPVGSNPNDVEKGSFNADAKPDLVSVNSGSNNISVLLNICQVAIGNLFDFNGDRRTDFAVFRPTGQPAWWAYPSLVPKTFGRGADAIVPADYDGDRVTDYGIYRPASGLWFVNANNGSPLYFLQFGDPGDVPVPADYDGDGKADIAVYRPGTGNWFVRQSSDHVTAVYTFGLSSDLPVPADYDGDGKDDIGVFRPSTGVWYIFRSSDSQFVIAPFGATGDKAVPGDYDGDAKADIAIYRPSSGTWYVYRSSDGGFTLANWGLTGDIPVAGDYDGDGRFDFAVWRPSDNIWYVLKSSDGAPIFNQWGISTDIPIPSAYVR